MEKRICKQCGLELTKEQFFCMRCGTKYEEEVTESLPEKEKEREEKGKSSSMVCSSCGNILKKGQRFCMKCGSKYEEKNDAKKPRKEEEEKKTVEPKEEAATGSKGKEEKTKEATISEKKAPTSSKICSKCGTALKANDSFCAKCGTKQEKEGKEKEEAEKDTVVSKEEVVSESKSKEEKTEKSTTSEEKAAISSIVCSVCGSPLKKEQRFCMKCGTKQEEKETFATEIPPVEQKEVVVEAVKEKKEEAKETVAFKEEVSWSMSEEKKTEESTTTEEKMSTSSRICPKCDAILQENDSFCINCGTKYEDEIVESLSEKEKKIEEKAKSSLKVCPVCGSSLEKGQKFCMKCGTKQEEKETFATETHPVEQKEVVVEAKEKKEEEKDTVEPKEENSWSMSEEKKTEESTTVEENAPISSKVCSVCGSPLEKGQKFCMKCGAKQEEKEALDRGIDPSTLGSEEEAVTLFAEQKSFPPQKLEIPNRSFEICPNCHNEIDSSVKVCPYCGKKLKKKHRLLFFLILLFFLLLVVFGYLFVAHRKHLFPFTLSQNIVEEKLIMPNVIGKKSEEARKILEDMGLSVRLELVETSESDKIGLVWRQETKEGTILSKGQEITLVVYCKAGEIEMISVVGLPFEEAQRKLEDLGFNVQIEEANDDQIEKGKVISQDKKEKEKFTKGTVVKLVVSLGKKESTSVGGSGNPDNPSQSNPGQSSTNPSTNPNQPSEALPTNKEWSNWMVSLPSGVTSSKYDIESRVEYRSRNKERKVFDTEFVSGWTLVEKQDVSTPTTYVMAKKDYETKYQNNPKYQIESAQPNGDYQVTVLHCDNSAHTNSIPADSNLQCPNGYQIHRVGTYSGLSKPYQVGEVFDSSRFGQYTCGYTHQAVNNTVSGVDSLYRVVMKIPSYRYYHERWTSDWSNWSVTKVVESATVSVETRTVYRYKLK